MFLPADRPFSWQNPPVMSIFLILMMFAAYFAWQANDEQREKTAIDYYLYSALPAIEFPAYLEHLQKTAPGKYQQLQAHKQPDKEQTRLTLLRMMSTDAVFQQRLHERSILKKSAFNFQRWLNERATYEDLLSHVVKYEYAYNPAKPSALTLFTHIFIHENIIHLLLNAVMLFVFGVALEILIGRLMFLSLFMSSGVLSAWLLNYLDSGAYYWNIGASGAVAGLVGCYLVIFFRQKIRFFYTLGIYFGYITAPAIMLLPVWFLFEFADYLVFSNSTSNLSHIGGISFGIVVGIAIKQLGLIDTRSMQPTEHNRQYDHELQTALTLIANLDFSRAHQQLLAMHKQYPDDEQVLWQLFNLEKVHPGSDAFHAYAHSIFSLQASNLQTEQTLYQTYIDYRNHATPQPRFTTEQLVKLCKLFANDKHVDAAETIFEYLQTNRPDNASLPELAYAIIRVYLQLQNMEKLEYYSALMHEKFPDSQEAKILATL